MKLATVISFILGFCYLCADSDFVVPKKNKKMSAGALKTECCDSAAGLLHLCTDISEQVAQVQRVLLHKSREILEEDSQSFFAKSGKKELQECLEKLQHYTTIMQQFKLGLKDEYTYLISLK